MLLGNLAWLSIDPLFFVLITLMTAGAIGVAITLHEYSHAATAYALGDLTAAYQGRLSLKPWVHLDVMGTLLLLLAGFGWGKPVPVNPFNLRGSPRASLATVAFAGPLANLATASLLAIPIKLELINWVSPFNFGYRPLALWGWNWILAGFVGMVILYSLVLGLFNLIPLAPLDGLKVAIGIAPAALARGLLVLESYGPAILMMLILLSYVTDLNPIWWLLGPAMQWLALLLIGRQL